jgi:D-alanyl-lipoteichoic acid acyltransferase DltB (MBOAT superfamily)
MLFNSLQFLVFFLVVTLWFFRIKNQKGRTWLLLMASCYFYMAFVPVYILILGGTIVIDYVAGIQIAKKQGKARKAWLVASIIANVGILACFKYINFLAANINDTLRLFHVTKDIPLLRIVLPIGLSFHTFQAMSYTIEVYRGHQPPERNFVTYALYVMFYPQLVAGPIERPQNVLPQLHEYRPYNGDNVKEGLARMLWGFFKKVVIADRLAMSVDYIFGHYEHASAGALAIGAVLYSFQIYCDFSGYSDIGIGAARVMNIRLMENFAQPYIARNIAGFWARWHISLSTWFRDYVYIPLGGNRKGEGRRKRNVFITFLLSGLWHGANWTFVAWGALHGALVTFGHGRAKDNKGEKSRFHRPKVLLFVVANFLLVTLFWIFFRAENLHKAIAYIGGIFRLQNGSNRIGINMAEFIFSLLLILIMMWRENRLPGHFIAGNSAFGWYVAGMVAVCYFFGVFSENQFIYFQF